MTLTSCSQTLQPALQFVSWFLNNPQVAKPNNDTLQFSGTSPCYVLQTSQFFVSRWRCTRFERQDRHRNRRDRWVFRFIQRRTCCVWHPSLPGGIGLETALQLAKKGAKVYVAGRSAEKGAAAVDKIRSVTGPASDENVQFLELDLADIKKTKAAAETFLATSQRLDILVNNAGLWDNTFSLTPRDKLESHIAWVLLIVFS